jgi:hypothetical protein
MEIDNTKLYKKSISMPKSVLTDIMSPLFRHPKNFEDRFSSLIFTFYYLRQDLEPMNMAARVYTSAQKARYAHG